MKTLQEIKNEMDNITQQMTSQINGLRAQATLVFSGLMKTKGPELEAMAKALLNSNDLTQVENDEFYHTWVRVDFSKIIDVNDPFQCELLAEYMEDQDCYHCDFKNSTLSNSIGEALLISFEDGSVYDQDSGKTIIRADQYRIQDQKSEHDGMLSIKRRNALIEAWMEQAGYYPSVLKVDRYGDAHFVKTSSETQKAS